MNINSIGYTGYAASAAAQANSKGETSATQEQLSNQQSAATVNEDTYVKSDQPAEDTGAVTYTPPKKLSKEQIDALKSQVQESMQALVKKILGAQAEVARNEDGGVDFLALAESLGMGTTPESAAQAISEDGMWGVNAVSTRLMNMALSLSNGDSSKAAELRAAVQKGFEEVGAIDTLPQVCQDTYTEVMKRFDYWEANGSMDGYGETTTADEGVAAN